MEEFSFPYLAPQDQQDSHFRRLPFPHFASSPLWFLPAAAAAASAGDCPRSLSSLGDALRHADDHMSGPDSEFASADGGSRRFLDEERMDMLWEDLDEEAAMRRAFCEQKKAVPTAVATTKARRLDALVLMSRRRSSVAAEQQQQPTVAEAKGGSGLIHRRRPNLMLMVKVLKKLLLIQKAASANNKPSLRYQKNP